MTWPFALLALVTLAGAIAAITLRNLVHCALCLAVTFAGLAALYLQLNAQFVGFVQVLVYIGAVAILIVFAILLTRSGEDTPPAPVVSSSWWAGILIALAALSAVAAGILCSVVVKRPVPNPSNVAVKQIGDKLMTNYVLPLEVIGLLLTAALIGAVIIAMNERKDVK